MGRSLRGAWRCPLRTSGWLGGRASGLFGEPVRRVFGMRGHIFRRIAVGLDGAALEALGALGVGGMPDTGCGTPHAGLSPQKFPDLDLMNQL